MAPVDLRVLIPHISESDVAFILSLLQLDPKKRSTAEEAKGSSYFKAYPLPCPLSELPVPSRDNNLVHSNSSILRKDENVSDFLGSLLV